MNAPTPIRPCRHREHTMKLGAATAGRTGSDHIPSLDGIRAAAAMTVFISHAGWGDIIPGGFGVTVFFFLSGYLITTLLRREIERTGTVNLAHFYLRRAYRILPPLYIVLGIALLLTLSGRMGHVEIHPWAVTAEVFFWTNYYSLFQGGQFLVPGTAVFWSLAVEEHFYLIFPLIFIVSVRRFPLVRTAQFLLAFCGLGLIWRFWLHSHGVANDYTYSATDARFDSLLYGCVLGLWMNPVMDADLRIGERARLALFLAAIGLLLVTFLDRNETFRQTLRYSLQGIALLPLFWLAIRHPKWPVFRWLNWPAVRYLGSISYTFYLSHFLILELVTQLGLGRVPEALLALSFTIAFATLMFYGVERPFARIRRRLHDDIGRPPSVRPITTAVQEARVATTDTAQ